MSNKVVVRVTPMPRDFLVEAKDGRSHNVPVTDRLVRKMDGLQHGYFYARHCPTNGFKLDRFAPFGAWADPAYA
jgi:hypothetical protein